MHVILEQTYHLTKTEIMNLEHKKIFFNKLIEPVNDFDEYDEDYVENGYESDYDGGCYSHSVYDNPYYNENLDMDQQSAEFWDNI